MDSFEPHTKTSYRQFWKEKRSLDLIVQEICLLCSSKGHPVTEGLAKFAIGNVLVDPRYSIFQGKEFRHDKCIALTELTVKLLLSKKGLALQLLSVQAYFTKDFGGQEHALHEHNKLFALCIEPLIKHVMRYEPEEDFRMMYRHIVYVCVLLSGMGDPTDEEVYKEAEAAVMSLLSEKDMKKFVKLGGSKKLAQLKEMVKLVAGIRIYNKAKNAGGAGVEDLPRILLAAYEATTSVLDQAFDRFNPKIRSLEVAISQNYEWDLKIPDNLSLSKTTRFGGSENLFAKNLLMLWQQVALYIRLMKKYITEDRLNVLATEQECLKELFALMNKLSGKVAVPSKKVFPTFIKLYKCFKVYTKSMVLTSVYNKMLKKMLEFAKVQQIPKPILMSLGKYEQKYEQYENAIDPERVLFGEIVFSHNQSNDYARENILEFGGFCPVMALLADGLILRANRKIGVLKYDNKFYGFWNDRAAYVFGKNPPKYINHILDFSKKNPDYIEIFQLRNQLNAQTGVEEVLEPHKTNKAFSDRSTQTHAHSPASTFDHRYMHSVWDMKKEAIQLADLTHCGTHSTQTNLSHFRRVAGVETVDVYDQPSQTNSDNASNVPTLQNFIFGLRGRRDDVQECIALTRPVDEEPYVRVLRCEVDPSSAGRRGAQQKKVTINDPLTDTE